MSKASAWATKLKQGQEDVLNLKDQKPESPPDVYIVGKAHRLRFYVTEAGDPSVVYLDTNGKVLAGGDITWTDDREKLLNAARWILDTFGESA